jgi:2-methylcitrate dehydratase PrpD
VNTINNPYTLGLAKFTANLRFEHIPTEVVERAKLLILDGLGCGIFGALPVHSRTLIDTLAALDTSTACGVWGTRQRLSAPHAALANGSLIQAFELDDGHALGSVHLGSGALPAILAMVETQGNLSGKDIITAMVAACEVAPRIGLCMEGFAAQGWHSGALSVFSSVAASASALRLSVEQTVHALGIAGTQAAGLMAAQYGAMVKRMHAGRGAQGGLYAALLAQRGYTGIDNLFEAEYGGFCTAYGGARSFDREQLTRGLGQEFETLRTSLKFYASAASTHTALDAVRGMQARHKFTADDVAAITVGASRRVVEHVGWPYVPKGLTSAQMNLPFCMATLLLEGDVFVEQFTDASIQDARRIALAQRVIVRESVAITAKGRAARHEVCVCLTLRDGREFEETVTAARGSAQRFASESDVVAKYVTLAGRVLPQAQVEQLGDFVKRLQKQLLAMPLAELLRLR